MRDHLFNELRKALRHLYDPDVLRKNKLMDILPVDAREGHVALQRTLIEAIEQLKPPSSLSAQSNSWRNYYILSSRYVQQFHQDEVAKGLGLSLRQIRRQDNLALKAMAEYLMSRYDLHASAVEQTNDAVLAAPAVPSQEDELQWLGRSQTPEMIEAKDLLLPLLKTIEPLANELQVRLKQDVEADLPRLMISLTPVKQSILMLLTTLIRQCPFGSLAIECSAEDEQITLRMTPSRVTASPLTPSASGLQPEDMSFAHRLVMLSGGTLEVARDETGVSITEICLRLPVVRRVSVLVLDDNEDALQLYQRYFTGTLYTYFGTTDPEQILPLAQKLRPHIILLDVMLPGLDGWEILSRLREHPQTRHIPVIVSTILPQAQLAHVLGAAAFIRKPVSQPDLLQALDSLMRVGSQDLAE